MKVRLLHSAIGQLAFSLGERPLQLGRAGGGADIELTWDSRVSRRHARLWRSGEQIWFEDLGSRNGSFIGELRIHGKMPLPPGAQVLIGETVLLVEPADKQADWEAVVTSPGLIPIGPLPDLPPLPDFPALTQPSMPPPRTPASMSFEAEPTQVMRSASPLPAPPPPTPQVVSDHTDILRAFARPNEVPPPAVTSGSFLHTRAHPRFVAAERVEVRVDERDELRQLWVRDISKGGLFVATDTPPQLGRIIEVRIQTPAGTVSLRAAVVHVVDPANAAGSGTAAGVGVQFVDITSEQRSAIQAYLDGLVQRLSFGAPKEPSPPTGEKIARDVKTFLERVEKNDLYSALEISPASPDSKVTGRIKELRESFKRASLSAPAPLSARVDRAMQVLERIEHRVSDTRARIEYDFRAGHVRAEERIQQAVAGTGPSIAELRRIWLVVAPERVDRAAFLTRQAFAARQRGAITEAITAAKKALEENPFFEELRGTLKAWLQVQEENRR